MRKSSYLKQVSEWGSILKLILILSMRKIDWRHPACLWRHWEVWKYHRSINKWKGYKLRKRYEVTKKVQSYEKGTKLQKKVRSYEKVTKLWTWYKGTKMLRNKVRKTLVMKLRDSNATYRDNLLWRIVMHYGEMPRTTLGQVTFGHR
jgi:hypothetical protein